MIPWLLVLGICVLVALLAGSFGCFIGCLLGARRRAEDVDRAYRLGREAATADSNSTLLAATSALDRTRELLEGQLQRFVGKVSL